MFSGTLISFLFDYFAIQKFTTNVYIFSCSDQFGLSGHAALSKISSANGFRVNFLSARANVGQVVDNITTQTKNLASVGIFVDYDCQSSDKILEAPEKIFATKYKWLIFERSTPIATSKAMTQLEKLNLFVETEITFANWNKSSNNGHQTTYALYDVYNNARTRGGKFNVTFDCFYIFPCEMNNSPYGCFSSSLLRSMSKYRNRNRLEDVNLPLGAVLPNADRYPRIEELIEYLQTDNNTSVDTLSRYTANVILLIRDVLLFNASFQRFTAWTSSGNDSYGELLEAVATREVEMGFAFFLLTKDRLKHLSVITQITEFRSRFFFLTADDVDLYGERFRGPFVNSVWFCVVFAIVLVSVGLKLTLNRDLISHGGASSLLTTFGTFCQQGSESIPKLISGRFLYMILLGVSITVYNYYTSVLVSTLIKNDSGNKINSNRALANSRLKVAFDDITYMRTFLNTTDDPEYRYLIKKKFELEKSLMKTQDGFQMVQNGMFAFHCEANTAFPVIQNTFTDRQICNLNVLRFRRDKLQSLVIAKNSPFHDIFAVKFFWMRETGIISKHQRHWIATKPSCFANNLFSSVGLTSTVAAFILLGIGYLVSLVILLLENLVSIYHKRMLWKSKEA